jgi:phospholipid-binding lipoprotein MlaA
VVLALALGGCAGFTSIFRDRPDLAARSPAAPTALEASWDGAADPREAAAEAHPAADPPGPIAQQRPGARPAPGDEPIEEYDPWEPFNEVTFEFNRGLDRWIIKPVAKAYNFVVPTMIQEMIGNGFDNIRFVPRVVNSLLQGKFAGAGREVSRFVINSTLGVGGLFDIAKKEFAIQKSNEDFGQTLGVWGAGPGAYLILPFLPPLTVRDGIGYVIDQALDPLAYFVPFFWERFSLTVGDTVNDRAFNLDLYQGFEETTVEFYSALRNAYLQRRAKLIKE